MDKIVSAIDFLSEYYDLPLNSKKIAPYIEILEKFKDNSSLPSLISKQYRPTEININTVGSYLWGCAQNYYGDVNKNCSPLCLGSISHDSYKDSCEFSGKCQYSIWTFSNNKLVNKYTAPSTKAYIYVDSNWKGFLESDIEMLKSSGIFYATILVTINSQHKIIMQMTSVNNLPILKQYPSVIYEDQEGQINEGNKEKDKTWVILLIILLLLIGLIIKHFFKTEKI